ncbi:MAG: hypothetical protein K2N75_04300 [Helicobacter sp.]|uniref:hypothetical protein n=1 Tax=Helicobacter sp. TaxID=218 RepID=UPI0023C7DDEC|nr:hypothetical protein [Helicobacter sp.]MDE7175251.1 hypothetical protein [Helicobacter sp.]
MPSQKLKELVKISDWDFLGLSEKIISSYTKPGDKVILPYMSADNFVFEIAINERQCLIYDNNPLVRINFEADFFYPSLAGIKSRLSEIKVVGDFPDCGVKKFLHPRTYNEAMAIRLFLDGEPKDAINLWIKCLSAEALKMPKTSKGELEELEYIDIKDFILKKYKIIFSEVDPMRLLLLHKSAPEFLHDEKELDEILKGTKVKLAHYAPYRFNVREYFSKNLLKMWFHNISKEQLMTAFVEDETAWNLRCKKDFLSLHKRLGSGGMILVEKANEYVIEEFFKLAFFYGYENVRAFCNTKGVQAYLMKKLG